MTGSLAATVRSGFAAARAEAAARRAPAERIVGLLHLLTSLALALLYLLPAALLVASWTLASVSAAGLISGLADVRAAETAAVAGLLLLAPAAAGLTARLACRVQRSRLHGVLGLTAPAAPAPDPEGPASAPARALSFLSGRGAWGAIVSSTAVGLVGTFSGAIAVGLVVYGVAASAGSLLGIAYASAAGSIDGLGLPLLLVVLGPLGALVGMRLVPVLVLLEAETTRRLLFDAPDVRIRRRLAQVQDSRLRMVDAAEAERRRIERDLHDGAQQRLLLVTMTLTRARARFDRDPALARRLLDQASSEAREVMAELREVARGLHPRVLTDHGLDAALPVAAGRCPVPVRVDTDLPDRPSPRAEGVAYYVACEALTNVAKHARAASVAVRAERVAARSGDLLRLTVRDDGAGGADPDSGTGLYGLWDRVAAVDGTLAVRSPVGGGTTLTADIPWRA
jgi:signal transduction histidine kinase